LINFTNNINGEAKSGGLGHKIQTANDEKLTNMAWYYQLLWYSKVKQNNET